MNLRILPSYHRKVSVMLVDFIESREVKTYHLSICMERYGYLGVKSLLIKRMFLIVD